MIRMSTKQKIILHKYRDGYSERRIARKLGINRETVRRYLSEYEKAHQKLSEAEKKDEVLIEELVKIPRYDSSNRGSKKFTEEISNEVDRLLQLNEEKHSRGLHKQVKRNIGKFPERYMFQLTQNEHDRLRSRNVTLKRGQYVKYLPYAFTEHGLLMLSSVLKSQRADKVNMIIIDTFVKIRELMLLNNDVVYQLEQVQNKLTEHDNQIIVILKYLNQLEKDKQAELEHKDRPRIGFKP